MPPIEEAIPEMKDLLYSMSTNVKDVESRVEKLSKQLGKDKSWSEKVTKQLDAASKVVDLAGKLFANSKGRGKVKVTIINNVSNLTLELVTQSCDGLFDKTAGRFECAPDIFILPGSVSAMTAVIRDTAINDNVNGVIYKAHVSSPYMKNYYLIVAWDNPLMGKVHYYMCVDNQPPQKNFLKSVVDSNHTGIIQSPQDGADCDISATSTFTSEEINVYIEPKLKTG